MKPKHCRHVAAAPQMSGEQRCIHCLRVLLPEGSKNHFARFTRVLDVILWGQSGFMGPQESNKRFAGLLTVPRLSREQIYYRDPVRLLSPITSPGIMKLSTRAHQSGPGAPLGVA